MLMCTPYHTITAAVVCSDVVRSVSPPSRDASRQSSMDTNAFQDESSTGKVEVRVTGLNRLISSIYPVSYTHLTLPTT